jgi:hypothetical protein
MVKAVLLALSLLVALAMALVILALSVYALDMILGTEIVKGIRHWIERSLK